MALVGLVGQPHGHRPAQAAHPLYSRQSHLRAAAVAKDTKLVMVLLVVLEVVAVLVRLEALEEQVIHLQQVPARGTLEGLVLAHMLRGQVVVLMRRHQQQPQGLEQLHH